MVLALLLSLAAPAIRADDPPVRIRLNHEQFLRGDRARVYVETADDGYLVVLHADPFGRVRVLFPLDPWDDAFVRRASRVEIRGRGDRDAFFVDAEEGAGTVLAALLPDPLSYEAFARGDHWDYRVLGAASLADDPVAGLLDIALRLAGETRFEYDAATYVVGRPVASGYGDPGPSLHVGFGYPYSYRLGFSYGHRYRYGYSRSRWHNPFYDPFCHDSFWGWGASCHGFGFGYSTVFFARPYGYRWPLWGGWGSGGGGFFTRAPSAGPRFVMRRERVTVARVESRRRADPASPERGSRVRGIVSREREVREPRFAPRTGGDQRGPAVTPRAREGGRESAVRPAAPRGRSEARPANPASRRPAVSRGSGGESRGSVRGVPSSGRGSGSRRR